QRHKRRLQRAERQKLAPTELAPAAERQGDERDAEHNGACQRPARPCARKGERAAAIGPRWMGEKQLEHHPLIEEGRADAQARKMQGKARVARRSGVSDARIGEPLTREPTMVAPRSHSTNTSRGV